MPCSRNGTSALDDLREVVLELGGLQPAQRVVAAERHDEDPHVALERPVEPRQAAGRRIAGHPGVHDLEMKALSVRPLLQQRRIGGTGRQTEARRQAVAEDDDARCRRFFRRRSDGRRYRS